MDARIQKICRNGLRNLKPQVHEHGQCHTTCDLKYQFIRIPKNASSWTRTFLHRHLFWHDNNFNRIEIETALICLRDPVSRWISGIVEYISLSRPTFDFNKSDSWLLDWILDAMVFDSHTVPQTAFLDGLVCKDVVWFWADTDYEKNFLSYLLDQKLLPQEFVKVDEEVYQHANDHHKDVRKIQNYNYLQNLCRHDSAVRSRIMQFYRFDYELIRSVDFYFSKT